MIEHPRRDPLRVRRLPGHPLPLDAPPPHGGTPQEQPGRGEVPRLTPGSGKDLPPAGGAPPGAQEQDSSGEAGAILFIFFYFVRNGCLVVRTAESTRGWWPSTSREGRRRSRNA